MNVGWIEDLGRLMKILVWAQLRGVLIEFRQRAAKSEWPLAPSDNSGAAVRVQLCPCHAPCRKPTRWAANFQPPPSKLTQGTQTRQSHPQLSIGLVLGFGAGSHFKDRVCTR